MTGVRTDEATAPATPTGFAITVPANWYELELHPDVRNNAINDLVTARLREVPELFAHRAALSRALREAARAAYDGGARFCATMVEGLGGAVLTATVTVSIVTVPDEQAGADAVAAHLTGIPRRGGDGIWRDVEQVQLPGLGRVPRTRGVEDITAPEGAGWVRSIVMQTFVPLPGPSPEQVALITGTSPVLALEAELFDLFDAVTGTFQFTGRPAVS
ncbi:MULTISPECIES: hypothetical protein [unclassified Solwaraspora]|uniref:hypothetical protein n=1 Tax=unclassified Solwaraspora TaxID=2627926 RepID=UPI00259B8AB9|nr:hypothetical protein [Solwaraspora sp. WMMA2056]WJK43062.1 hypothetical protein O7608_12100 [Solwaraspora sp. WMMA2056]